MLDTLVKSVTRNEAELSFKNSVFNKNSKENAGKSYPNPEILETNSETWLKFIGVEDLTSIVKAAMRKIAQDIFLKNVEENGGVFNHDEFVESFADFAAAAESMAALENEIETLVANQQILITDVSFGEVDANDNPTERATEIQNQLKETAAQLRPLKVRLAQVTAKNKEKGVKIAATRALNKAKKEQEAAALKAATATAQAAA